MKKIILALAVLALLGCSGEKKSEGKMEESSKEFCGWTTNGACQVDDDCQMSGCSKQVCMAKAEGEVITICEFKDCYQAEKYQKSCGCVAGTCQWH
jgi:eight-cysteine-cluster-containing protein